MSVYEIIFPLLIIISLGIVIAVLAKHFPEAAKKVSSPAAEEKKRWRSIFLAKGEGLLRYVRVLVLKIDNKLNNIIKNVRSKKEKLSNSLKDYRGKTKEHEESVEAIKEEYDVEPEYREPTEFEGLISEVKEVEEDPEEVKPKVISKKIYKPKPKKIAQEIVKAPSIRKIDKEVYWKKKEGMLLKSISNDPQNIGLYLQLGRLYFNQHSWEDAYESFQEAIRLDSTNIKAKEELKRVLKYIKK